MSRRLRTSEIRLSVALIDGSSGKTIEVERTLDKKTVPQTALRGWMNSLVNDLVASVPDYWLIQDGEPNAES